MTEQTEHRHDEEERVINARSVIDGATTLAEAAMQAHGFAAEMRRLHDEGFLLREPVADDQAVAYKPPGENPNIIGEHHHVHEHAHDDHADFGI